MKGGAALSEVLAALAAQGLDQAEVFAKTSRSRHYEVGAGGEAACASEEAGWAVRASDGQGSFFVAASGEPTASFAWPKAERPPLALPEPAAGPPWNPPKDLDAALLSEREGLGFLAALARDLAAEAPRSRLLAARLDDGGSESRIESSRGVAAAWRNRLAALHVEAATAGGAVVELAAAERDARRLLPKALARRLADRLAVAAGQPVERDRGEMLLAPAVAARLLAGLVPLFVGAGSRARLEALRDRQGRVGSAALTVIDDGRLPGGALEAPVDGAGSPAREVVLIEAGTAARVLDGPGSLRRPGWRDLPRPGVSHLYLAPRSRASVASLVAQVARGYYFIDAPGPGSFDLERDHFRLPVRGFALEAGAARAPVAGVWLTGAVSAFLHGLQATGRDLAFLPLAGMVGSPTLLVTGLEVVGEPE